MFERTQNVDGTSLMGIIRTNYSYLVQKLGEPCIATRDRFEKVNICWRLKFRNDVEEVVTIYDWKEENPPYQGEYDWHIGGHSKHVVRQLEEVLGLKGEVWSPNFSRSLVTQTDRSK